MLQQRSGAMIHECGNNLFLIDLDQPREGFRHFISSWILLEKGGAVLVDTGPRSTIPVLKQALRKLGITKIPYILLTHIHIDHAGGTGLLMNDYPEAKVICHPKGIRHMVQPEKLWESSRQVLGPLARSIRRNRSDSPGAYRLSQHYRTGGRSGEGA